jgi:8-oxo-dGTP pyrophosphatase MutT (NUDIX family)
MSRDLTIDDVIRALRGPLPGAAAQERMATRPRPTMAEFEHEGPPRPGAVLILLYPQDGALCFPLTRRTERVANHKGQISLPGGAQEPQDASLWETALREAHEEIAIDPAKVRYLGALSPLVIPASNFEVHPFVGYQEGVPAMRPNPAEVAEIIPLPLRGILEPSVKAHETWTLRGRRVEVSFYRYQQHVIWGATAMILSEFEVLLEAATPPA